MSKAPHSESSRRFGTVIISHGPEVVVKVEDDLVACRGRRKLGKTVCGDRVWLSDDQPPVLDGIAPRDNVFPRSDRRGRQQIVAANLARVVIVVAPKPEPTRDLINRYLVACENLELPAVICFNKADLIDAEARTGWDSQAKLYRKLGYPVVYSSTKSSPGLGELAKLLADGPSILVGQSGVGKSSLINQLLPDLALKTQAISTATAKGKHTTTATTWYDREGAGPIIDSPGVWEYGIWKMPWSDVARGFVEFSTYAQECRFSNCQHLSEPDCGVQAAADAGRIDPSRLASYRRIVGALEQIPDPGG
ncbi:MAG: ribosome small subunit-dependent GTPase A [Pseudomonadota bacterium]